MRFVRATALLALVALGAASRAQGLDVEVRVGDGPWRRASAVEARLGTPVSLRVARVPGGTIRWYRIVPDATTAYNNAAWPWDPGAYRWIGYAKIRHARHELESARGRWELAPEPVVGSRWYQAEVEIAGRVLASPGLERNDRRGLSPEVQRVSLRDGDDLVGWLTGFYEVPGIFGAVPYQVRNHLGVDCADVLMAAWALASGRPIERDWNVVALTRELPVVAATSIDEGRPARRLRWGEDVRRGDFLAVKYAGWRQFGHVGALYGDDGDGLLGSEDLVIHAGPQALHVSKLAEGAFDGEVKILRPPSAAAR